MIKELRVKHGLTQQELADKAGVTRTALSMLENGKNNLSIEMAKKLGKVFNIDWKELFKD